MIYRSLLNKRRIKMAWTPFARLDHDKSGPHYSSGHFEESPLFDWYTIHARVETWAFGRLILLRRYQHP